MKAPAFALALFMVASRSVHAHDIDVEQLKREIIAETLEVIRPCLTHGLVKRHWVYKYRNPDGSITFKGEPHDELELIKITHLNWGDYPSCGDSLRRYGLEID